MSSVFEIEGVREIPWHNLWWFSLTWILSWFVLLLINMWHNNTLIDTWFVLTHRKTMLFWITVYWMLLFVNVVSGAPPSRLCQCVIVFMSNLVQILFALNDLSYTNTITLMSWFIFFILYVFALYYIVCMYPLYTTCALLLLSIVWLKYVFPCVLLVDNYVSLNQCDLNFHFFETWPWWFVWWSWRVHLTLLIFTFDLDLYWWYLW